MDKTYTLGINPENNRQTLTLNSPISDIPYGVWRDIGRLAGKSYETPTSVVYEFLDPAQVLAALDILRGAMWISTTLLRRDKLAAHLLNLYWTGAGDAGTNRAIFSFHGTIPISADDVRKTLNDGKSCTIQHDGKRITETEYFLILADKILTDIRS